MSIRQLLTKSDLAKLLREKKALAKARSVSEEAVAMYQRHPEWPSKERQDVVWVLAEMLRLTTFVNADVIAQGLAGFDPDSAAIEASRIMLERL